MAQPLSLTAVRGVNVKHPAQRLHNNSGLDSIGIYPEDPIPNRDKQHVL